MELDSKEHGKYIGTLLEVRKKETYDSEVEKDFATRFEALDTGWKITREPEPIPVGTYVMIPDFKFKKGNSKVYLEVVGFWTPEYLEEKMKKLNLLGDIDMIIAVDKRLACRKIEKARKKFKVIYYNRKIPLKPLLNHLSVREERLVEEQSKGLQVDDLILQKPIVEIEEIAERLGVLVDALKKVLKGRRFPGYSRIGDIFIKETKLREIDKKLEKHLNFEELNLDKASRIIEEEGGRKPAQILEALGYRIEWKGIDPKSARIHRKAPVYLN
jgi:hypothetical protein